MLDFEVSLFYKLIAKLIDTIPNKIEGYEIALIIASILIPIWIGKISVTIINKKYK